MNPDWDSFDARTRDLSARREADLIRDLATARARAARTHPGVCQCVPCKVRRADAVAAAVKAKAGA